MLTKTTKEREKPSLPASSDPIVLESSELADLMAEAQAQQAEQERQRRMEVARSRPKTARVRYEYD